MIPDRLIKAYLPRMREAAARHALDPTLLLAVAWVASGLDPTATGPGVTRGLFRMPSSAAARLGAASCDLATPRTAIDLAASHLADLLARLVLPRAALAAFHAGPAAAARNAIRPESHRFARDVMAAWAWARENAEAIMARPCTPSDNKWRMLTPRGDASAVPIPDAALPVLVLLAERLGLAFYMDSEQRRVCVSLPPTASPSAARKRPLICPVPGATREQCGLYEGATALDILVPAGTPIIAAAGGRLIQSGLDAGIWIALDEPISYGKGEPFPLIHYGSLSRLRFHVEQGARDGPCVEQGGLIAWSGAGRVPHVSFSIVGNRERTRRLEPLQLAAWLGWR